MTFTSWQFGIFVAIVFGAYYLPPLRALQVQLLVVASLFFYGYGQPELLPLLAVAVFGTYLFLMLALRNRPIWLPIGIAFNLALLAFFKYKFLFFDLRDAGLLASRQSIFSCDCRCRSEFRFSCSTTSVCWST